MDNKFWMHVVRLSEAFSEAGLTPDERCAFIVRQFENLPPVAQREVLGALRTVSYGLPDVHSIVNAKALQLEQERKKAAAKRSAAG
ncbi:MAG: hypothetical protein L0211_02510 [Planctomycetaceae bacterium]|nr:hypothetical protein [Planctomycetaceae bacterium]